ncbi:hypothetical protein A374_00350 [Fictibacillus macauensis ZFHKF-1]|uniref:Uncharacterized protein n=1 Tax=Fictibacillus macauensis ZFHKF-1 TaxID=1196324 RepID=I8UKM2_9BACL|nr:hypothetical protein [Fictibacillus macauensis]EIT87378.1 hypothetical protein A374_00350 [Fictibacillus macauensis ZFHKF-1]
MLYSFRHHRRAFTLFLLIFERIYEMISSFSLFLSLTYVVGSKLPGLRANLGLLRANGPGLRAFTEELAMAAYMQDNLASNERTT